MSDKMLTFEEWAKKHCIQDELNINAVFEDARVGMIPAENAVVIPPVSEWPEWATGVRMVFEEGGAWNTPTSTGVSSTSQRIKTVPETHIPRPKPVWVPQVGDRVFLLWDFIGCPYVQVGKLVQVNGINVQVLVDGVERAWGLANVKPFHESHIGKPWDEIPGGYK